MSPTEQGPEQQTTDRIGQLSPIFVETLSHPSTFQVSDSARLARGQVYNNIPRSLTPEEVQNLGMQVAVTALGPQTIGEGSATLQDANTAQVRALRWLGQRSLAGGDIDTMSSVITVLLKHAGIRGKVAAVALWYERFIQD